MSVGPSPKNCEAAIFPGATRTRGIWRGESGAGEQGWKRRSVADNLDVDLPRSWAIIEVDEDDLLPRTEFERTIRKWNAHRWADQRGADVGETVPVAPSSIVVVMYTFWRDAVDGVPEVFKHPLLEFDRRDGRGGAGDKDRSNAVDEAGMRERSFNLWSEIVNVVEAACRELEGR